MSKVSIFKFNVQCLKSTSELVVHKDDSFVNDIDGGVAFWPETVLGDSLMIGFADTFNFIKSYKQLPKSIGKSAQLENVVSSLKETSNPVVMILYP